MRLGVDQKTPGHFMIDVFFWAKNTVHHRGEGMHCLLKNLRGEWIPPMSVLAPIY
jgi:hypothetical protein